MTPNTHSNTHTHTHTKTLIPQVMPYSTGCATPLSNFEAGLNYKDVNDPAIMVWV